MAEKHLIAAVAKKLEGLSRKERVAKVRKLASTSSDDEKFVRETFPDLYKEAFTNARRAAGVRSESARPRTRSAARH